MLECVQRQVERLDTSARGPEEGRCTAVGGEIMADERSHTEFQALADDLRAMLARIKARDLEATTDVER